MPGRADIAATLRERIKSGVYPVGSRMPSTREIIAELGGSRATTSAALHLLEDEGFLTTKAKSAAVVRSAEAIGDGHEPGLADVRDELLALRGEVAKVQQRLDEVVELLLNDRDMLNG